ncbi:ATP-dependent nuclease [Anaerotignum sp. MB30-C6]|uniref:ATP-dependent nuclease n=1 Tax=Anaerotignum sp. MB30-C6 TaxID=3070814 RepID=UPI0027DD5627|nr:AAA family ATPase [Anaerotignum sp. MB30-C6]WMI80555.1 AAA family ATPase [Anaerotignum sp. MB30-C6]
MSNIRMVIHNIKGIHHGTIELPIDNGIYAIVGNNGIGKSTIMACMAQLVSRHNLGLLKPEDYSSDSYIEFMYEDQKDKWYCENNFWKADSFPRTLRFNGTYEGSLFYGMRFRDSKNVDELMEAGKIEEDSIVDADSYIQESLGKILHNNSKYYKGLKRIRNKYIAEKLNLKNTPYFMTTPTSLISQYRMSSGECLLISLLHFIYNSIIRRSLPIDQPVLMLIDEIELALHPVAIVNLLELFQELTNKYKNLTVILTSHSSEVIRKINPKNLFKVERINDETNNFNVINPCYPGYAIRDVYMHDGFDYLLLVEDELAKIIVKKAIEELKLENSKLINVLPVGGWQNVLKLQIELITNNVLGVGKQVFSVLDGDVQSKIQKQYKSTRKLFLPVNSVEKYLRNVLFENPVLPVKKRINDVFFSLESVDSLILNYKESENELSKLLGDDYKTDTDGKRLFAVLLKELKKRRITEESFVNSLYQIIRDNVDFTKFYDSLRDEFTR